MLLSCPECNRDVSDRATACPQCGFPIAEHLRDAAEQRRQAEERSSRAAIGEVDCTICLARGFRTISLPLPDGRQREQFDWCGVCEHTGRVTLCKSSRGYFAVARVHVEAFVAGTREVGDDLVVFLGPNEPPPHRYPSPGERVVTEP